MQIQSLTLFRTHSRCSVRADCQLYTRQLPTADRGSLDMTFKTPHCLCLLTDAASLSPSWLFHEVVSSHTSKSVPKLLPPSEKKFFFFAGTLFIQGPPLRSPKFLCTPVPILGLVQGNRIACLRGQSDRGSRVKACVIRLCQRQAWVPARCWPVCVEQTKAPPYRVSLSKSLLSSRGGQTSLHQKDFLGDF